MVGWKISEFGRLPIEERERLILELLDKKKMATITDLAKELNSSFHVVSKTVYGMEVKGLVVIKQIGKAKLIFKK